MRIEDKIGRSVGRCVDEHKLIEDGDRILVCLSGGKDSYTLLQMLRRLQSRAPVGFSLLAYHLDQKQPGYDGQPLARWLRSEGVDYYWEEENTYSIVVDKVPSTSTYCSLCSRLRRGVIYNAAERLNCNKIALGHHRDDAIETLMLNMMFSGSLAGMPARWKTKDSRNTVIRPLLYTAEDDIVSYVEQQSFPILPCNLCGSQDNLKRQAVKQMLSNMEALAPNVRESMLAAMRHVKSSHLLSSLQTDCATEHNEETPVPGVDDRGGAGNDFARGSLRRRVRSLPVTPS